MTQSLQGNILTPGGWVRGTIAFDQHILRIDGQAGDPASNRDDFILPGFIDLHVHGGGGRDFMQAGDAAQNIARLLASHGTTSLLATTMTAPDSDIDHALRGCSARTWKVRSSTRPSLARNPTTRVSRRSRR